MNLGVELISNFEKWRQGFSAHLSIKDNDIAPPWGNKLQGWLWAAYWAEPSCTWKFENDPAPLDIAPLIDSTILMKQKRSKMLGKLA